MSGGGSVLSPSHTVLFHGVADLGVILAVCIHMVVT